MGFLIPIVKVAAAAIAKSAVAKAVVKLAVTAIVSKVATKAISKLIAKRANTDAPSGGEGGGRIQLPPATDNKLPVLYGSAFLSGVVVDAKISTDQKFMWYVLAFCEGNNNITFDTTNGVFLDSKKVTFSGAVGRVESLTTNTSGYNVQVDNKMAGKIFIYLYTNGYNTGYVAGTPDAQTVLTDSTTGGGIPVDLRWSSPLYTDAGQSPTMNNTCFAIVRVEYNSDAGTTSLPTLQCKITNNLGASNGARPGDAILEYMTNERYGCALPLENIDTTSLTNLNTYSNQSITYYDSAGTLQVQPYRYRINGPLDTSNSCLDNLQFLVDACDSWLQYTETTGKWRVVPNMPHSGTIASLYNVNANNDKSCNVIGGIQISPIDLNETYNQVEVAYPNTNVRDQTDYQIVDLTDTTTSWYPTFNSVLSPNEAINRLNITLPLVNNAVQAKYIAARRLLQSREDLVISCTLDYSGIQIDAGDVVRVNHNAYGWTDKLFRVSTVSEVQDEQGNLMAMIEAFEYNGSIYTDVTVRDYVPADNTGLIDPNVISKPCPPTVINFTDANALVTGFTVTTCVPDQGVIKYMDFNYGTTNVVSNHQLYRTVQSAAGQAFTNSDSGNSIYSNVTITVNDLPANTYYWSATARNDTAGRFSDGSAAYNWGGANIQPYDPNTTQGGLPGTVYRPNSIPANAIVGGTISVNYNGNVITSPTQTINFRGSLVTIAKPNNTANVTFVGFATVPYGYYDYSIGDPPANIVTNPSNIASFGTNVKTANFDTPKYIIGTNVDANYIWPYYQGTSDTANGYVADSTSSFNPATAAVFNITNGTNNWYVLDYSKYTYNGNAGTSDSIQILGRYCFISNANANIQLVKFGTQTGNATECQAVTTNLGQIELIQGIPTEYFFNDAIKGTTDGAGILIRNMTTNSNVTIVTGDFLVGSNVAPPALL